MTKWYYGEPEDSTSNHEDDAWNFNSDYYKRRKAIAEEIKRQYYERQESIRNHPPDEDDWNK